MLFVKYAFTLMELLVAIAILSIISSIILSSLSSARSNSNDALRIQAITQIHRALEMFYLENGYYPRSSNDGSTRYVCAADFTPSGLCGPSNSSFTGYEVFQPYIDAIDPYLGEVNYPETITYGFNINTDFDPSNDEDRDFNRATYRCIQYASGSFTGPEDLRCQNYQLLYFLQDDNSTCVFNSPNPNQTHIPTGTPLYSRGTSCTIISTN